MTDGHITAARHFFYYYLIESFNSENEDDLMTNEDNNAGGLTPTKEADEVWCKYMLFAKMFANSIDRFATKYFY